MAIQVLLRRNIDGVGEVGEIVRVKNGYARNFLIPRGWAAVPSANALGRITKDKEREAVREAQDAEYRSALAEQLAKLTLTIEARAGEDGHLYGSVGPRHVMEALGAKGYPFDIRQIRFEPVRELGEYEVPLNLTREHVVDLKLWVVQDAANAAAERAERLEREAAEAAAAAIAAEAGAGQEGEVPVPTED